MCVGISECVCVCGCFMSCSELMSSFQGIFPPHAQCFSRIRSRHPAQHNTLTKNEWMYECFILSYNLFCLLQHDGDDCWKWPPAVLPQIMTKLLSCSSRSLKALLYWDDFNCLCTTILLGHWVQITQPEKDPGHCRLIDCAFTRTQDPSPHAALGK